MPNYLEEYKQYYASRAKRYADNSNYTNSYAAEQALSAAMQSCSTLEEFKDKVGNLPDQCAFALLKDEFLMEQAHFAHHQEPYRKSISDQVLAGLPNCQNVQEAITLVQEASHAGNAAIVADEFQQELFSRLRQMDEVEIYANAVVPDKYKTAMQASATETRQLINTGAKENTVECQKFVPNWQPQPITCKEARHFRLAPYSVEHLQEKIDQYTSIINA